MTERPLKFDPLADPPMIERRRDPTPGDLRDGTIYHYEAGSPVIDAVNVALFANRPLLVSGRPGSGKSSLAPNLARRQNRRYYSFVVNSRTQAADLLWTSDMVRRLADAQTQRLRPRDEFYVQPGVLWWAFDPRSACRRGLADDVAIGTGDLAIEPDEFALGHSDDRPAVVLIDEIDKADPDVPNDLLVPLGSHEFRHPGGVTRARSKPLVIITTNGERDLPPAFRRRCIEITLKAPNAQELVNIAKLHFGADDEQIYQKFAERTCEAQKNAERGERTPSTAEFLDAIHAWRGLADGRADQAMLLDTIANLAIRKPVSETD